MDALTLVIAAVGGIVIGVGGGVFVQSRLANRGLQAARKEAERIGKEADDQAKRLVNDARHEAREARRESDAALRDRRKEAQRFESRLAGREQALDKRQEGMERREQSLGDREQETEERLVQADELLAQRLRQVEEAAGLTVADARAHIMEQAEGEMKHDLARRYYELEKQMLSEVDEKARKAIALSIQRLASEVVSETTTAQVALPNDEMKGRLIGREGRNIRAIESATGVDLIVDDTPEAVTISCFDPIRREAARLALTNLIADGRIHPARIEEAVDKARSEVETTIKRAGEQAVLDAGVRGLHPELVHLVGRLKFRYSYGENVLLHSVEVARIAGMIAGEVGADPQIAKAGGLLHDIGKALTHEVEGSHIEIGDEIARRYNLSDAVKTAIAEHHEDDRGSAEAFIVAAADAISAARPGARRDTVEFYLKRLEALEDVANSFDGVQKSYAIQAGREVRILVEPESVDDVGAASLARDVVKKIQENLVYPGEIKVTVVRETRATEVAH